MSDNKEVKRKPRKRDNPATRKRAIHFTIYHPSGDQVPLSVINDLDQIIKDHIKHHGLVTATAIT